MNSLQRDKSREKYQGREMDSLNTQHLERQALSTHLKIGIMTRGQENIYYNERLKNPEFTGYFYVQADLNTGKVAGHYYNTHTRVTFENPPIIQPLDKTSWLNQRI